MISFIRWQHNTEWIGRKKMELMEAIAKRESVRSYEDRPVPEEKLLKVLEAARLAPSASNRQRYKFIVVRDAERRRHVAQAPVVIAAVSTMPEYVMRCEVPAYAVDLAIAVDHMTLAAVDEGLGTCWIGAFSQKEARAVLGVPDDCKIVTLLPLGFPRQGRREKIRKSLDEIVCYETFEE
jgi:nitroreductase